MGSDQSLVSTLMAKLSATFRIRDLGVPGFFLGIETVHLDGSMLLSQKRYMTDILKRAGRTDYKLLATPIPVSRPVVESTDLYADPTRYRSLAVALQYLTVTRHDLSYAINLLCQHMHTPTVAHWAQLKRVLRYVKGTLHYGLRLRKSSNTDIHAFSDPD
ncbi:uncharacterized protein LOC116010800 [Ipomoea triloba]|uniref:uncharacterized protein LOC116010800 n=1 Tax=Ipomoea triloba TaxID=35885 RepID=UPI00125DE509|nr:uncharacterized protein LOC116010800 [Ipomoea triloba]